MIEDFVIFNSCLDPCSDEERGSEVDLSHIIDVSTECILEWAQLGHSNETIFPSTFHIPFVY